MILNCFAINFIMLFTFKRKVVDDETKITKNRGNKKKFLLILSYLIKFNLIFQYIIFY